MQPQLTPLAYSIKDAVRVSSIGRTRMYALIKAESLKALKVGKRTFVHTESLRRLIAPES
jgi:hypothetical protein